MQWCSTSQQMDGTCGDATNVVLVKLRSRAEAVTRGAAGGRAGAACSTQLRIMLLKLTHRRGGGGRVGRAHICLTDHKTCDSCKKSQRRRGAHMTCTGGSWIEDAHRGEGGRRGRSGIVSAVKKKTTKKTLSEDPVGGLHSHDSAND